MRDAAAEKIDKHRRTAVASAYQQVLFADAEAVETDPQVCFTYPLEQYPAHRLYQGRTRFGKHYYELPAELNDEEASCAALLDNLPQVRFWVRNLVRDRYSFWLPLVSGKFFPDFVALLTNGRILVVEYKGEHLRDAHDATAKQAIGEIWAAQGEGRCLFLMVGKEDMAAKLHAVAG